MTKFTTTLALTAAFFGFTPGSSPARDTPAKPAASAAAATPAAALADSPVVLMKTSLGEIKIELNRKKAPLTTANFLKYVDEKFYDQTVFHRVIGSFMIQGGGFAKTNDSVVQKDTNASVKNESNNGLKNDTGTIAMARSSNPDSATSQFFINVKNNAGLNYPARGGYTVFGKVVGGMDVVRKIENVETGIRSLKAKTPGGSLIDAPMRDVPNQDVVIESVRLAGADDKADDNQPAATDGKEHAKKEEKKVGGLEN